MIGLPVKDGTDAQLRINHFGPFLLTKLLLPGLTQNARIVNVSSRAHKQGSLKIERNKLVGTPSHWYVLHCQVLDKAGVAQMRPDECILVHFQFLQDFQAMLVSVLRGYCRLHSSSERLQAPLTLRPGKICNAPQGRPASLAAFASSAIGLR